jgi:hypothetical protein
MTLGHKSGRKKIMTRLMPPGQNPSTRLLPLKHKVNVYGTSISKCLLAIVLFVESEEEGGDEENTEAFKKRRRFKLFFES